jgi:hypothetical protein
MADYLLIGLTFAVAVGTKHGNLVLNKAEVAAMYALTALSAEAHQDQA